MNHGTQADEAQDPHRSISLQHMAKLSRQNYQKALDQLGFLQRYWAAVRYMRSALLQNGEGILQVTLTEDGMPASPTRLSDQLTEWLASASALGNGDRESRYEIKRSQADRTSRRLELHGHAQFPHRQEFQRDLINEAMSR